jgi:hypothetical protein
MFNVYSKFYPKTSIRKQNKKSVSIISEQPSYIGSFSREFCFLFQGCLFSLKIKICFTFLFHQRVHFIILKQSPVSQIKEQRLKWHNCSLKWGLCKVSSLKFWIHVYTNIFCLKRLLLEKKAGNYKTSSKSIKFCIKKKNSLLYVYLFKKGSYLNLRALFYISICTIVEMYFICLLSMIMPSRESDHHFRLRQMLSTPK